MSMINPYPSFVIYIEESLLVKALETRVHLMHIKKRKMYLGTISLMITSQKKKPRKFLLTSSDIVLSL